MLGEEMRILTISAFLFLAGSIALANEKPDDSQLQKLAKQFRDTEINGRAPILEKLIPLIEANLKKKYPKDARTYFTKLLGKPDGREIDRSEPYRSPLGFVERDQKDYQNIFCYVIKSEDRMNEEVMIDARPPGPPEYYGTVSVGPSLKSTIGKSRAKENNETSPSGQQNGADQPATAPELKSQDDEKPQLESVECSQ